MERVDVAVVGAGQAGLATSYELTAAGIDHVVLERGRVGQSWRGRWDSFCLVTPNWTLQLPGHRYDGEDPDGYLPRDELVAYLAAYADSFGGPVREGVDVTAVQARSGDGFVLRTSSGELLSRAVVLTTGAYQRPFRPHADALPPDLLQIDVEGYRNPSQLPDGAVLLVGSGQTGCQLAEELMEAGREVVLSCGRAPWVPRRLGGRDIVWWAVETGYMNQPVEALPHPTARLFANLLATGHGGGHDLHLRTLSAAGVTLVGRFAGATGQKARFEPDLAESVAWGDERRRQFMELVRSTVAERGWEQPDIPDPAPFVASVPESIDLRSFGAVVFTGGFRPDYGSLVPWPEAFDELGFPIHRDGESAVVPGLFFVGVHFLRTRKSSLLLGVGEDAAIVARGVAARLARVSR
jgi:Pyridine nucleotide-disulphide oxidoreductase